MQDSSSPSTQIWTDNRNLAFLFAAGWISLIVFGRPLGAVSAVIERSIAVAALVPLWIFIGWKTKSVTLPLAGSLLTVLWQSVEGTLNRFPNPPWFSHYNIAGKTLVIMVSVLVVAWLGQRHWTQYGFTFRFRPNTRRRAFSIVLAVVVFQSALTIIVVKAGLLSQDDLIKRCAISRIPIWEVALFQFVVVALAEEFAVRGFLQTHLDDLFGARRKFWGADLGWGFVIVALVFTAVHMLEVRTWPIRFVWNPSAAISVLPFALIAGYLRVYTGNLVGSILIHGLWNGLGQVVWCYLFIHHLY